MEPNKSENTQQTHPDQTGMSPEEKRGPSRVRDRKDMEKIFKGHGFRTIGQVILLIFMIFLISPSSSQIINYYLKQQNMEMLILLNLLSILLLHLLTLKIQLERH